jgi:hypothetical protein
LILIKHDFKKIYYFNFTYFFYSRGALPAVTVVDEAASTTSKVVAGTVKGSSSYNNLSIYKKKMFLILKVL